MFGAFFGVISLAIAAGAGIFGFIAMRNFTRRRLRFIDAAQGPAAPIVAGIGAALLAWPVTWLPLIGASTALFFGLGVGGGLVAGKQDIVRGRLNP